MLAYLSIIGEGFKERKYKVFTNKSEAMAYNKPYYKGSYYMIELIEIELVTDQFMEQVLQPKESHEINLNSSL